MPKNNETDKNFVLGKSKTCIVEFLKELDEHRFFTRIINVKEKGNGMGEPVWFAKFREQQEKFNGQVVDFMVEQNKRWDQQMEFNKQVINRLDNLDHRIDNLVTKNNLKE